MLGRLATVALLGLLLGTALPGQSEAPAAASPAQVREYQKLQADAAKQTGSKQAETLARLAELDYAFAATSFAAGQPEPGQRHLDLAAHWADQAMVLLRSEAAAGKTNGMQKVEMSFQKIAFGLSGLAAQVRLRERPSVLAEDTHFAQLRAQLLNFMFAPKKK
ncbi:MAG TPA: hypothetical protein VIC54_04855 [Terriglobales bacterium]|jgi:hypothetical protein